MTTLARKSTKGAQTPWDASSLIGDFYFIAPVVAAPNPVPPGTPAQVATVVKLVDEGNFLFA